MLKSEELINKVKLYNKFLNPLTLSKAYDFALKAHKTQKRDEGVPYIIHPVAVADIFVTPSTRFATSSPNSFLTVSYVTFVSSMVSCKRPVVIVALSSFKSESISATAMG